MSVYPLETKQNTILSRIAAGDEKAFEECINTYGNLIWALARKFTAMQSDAEDAVQEIFLEIWQNAKRYDSAKAKEITFITMIARRRLIDRLRKTYRSPQTQTIEGMIETPRYNNVESKIHVRLQAERAVEAMNNLRPEQRMMMILNVYEGMSHSEIADRTGIPFGTVKTRIRRGFKQIRKAMHFRSLRKEAVAA